MIDGKLFDKMVRDHPLPCSVRQPIFVNTHAGVSCARAPRKQKTIRRDSGKTHYWQRLHLTEQTQLVLSGDFLQLPPVGERGSMVQPIFAFEAKTWKNCVGGPVLLRKVFRQKEQCQLLSLYEIAPPLIIMLINV